MTGARCSVAVCRNCIMKTKQDDRTKHIRYHKFPKEPERITIWMDNCHREKKSNPANSFICSEHFTEDDYERDLQSELLGLDKKKRLKKTAFPTKLLTAQDLDDFLEEQVDKKLNAPYIPPQNREIKIENVFSMNMNDPPSSPVTNFMEVNNIEPEHKPLPLPVPIVLMLPYKTSLNKETQTIDVPVINKPTEIKPNDPNSDSPNISNVIINCTCGYKDKYDKLSPKFKKIGTKTQLLEKRYSNLRHLFLKNKLKMKDLKREKAMNILTIKRLSKEIKTQKSEENKKDEQISSCEAALKSVFSESQIKLLMGKKKVVWTAEDLSKAFTLLYFSKKTYLFLKHVIGMPLPGLSTLKRTAAKYNYKGKELEKDETEINSMQS